MEYKRGEQFEGEEGRKGRGWVSMEVRDCSGKVLIPLSFPVIVLLVS